MIKYPLEIELTNKCTLKCISCISKDLEITGFMQENTFTALLSFIKNNGDNIDYISFGGLGDNFIHPEIISFLDKLIILEKYNIPILIPTKGISVNDEIIEKLLELKSKGVKVNIQIGVFSLDKKIQNYMSGLYKNNKLIFDFYEKNNIFIKKLKKARLDFSFELLLNKFSHLETKRFSIFCEKLGVEGVVHQLHNFGGKLKEYKSLVSTHSEEYNAFHCSFDKSLEDKKDAYYNDICGFFPFVDFNGDIFPGTFCQHYHIGNILNYEKNIFSLVNDCKEIINLKNKYCAKCVYNPKK